MNKVMLGKGKALWRVTLLATFSILMMLVSACGGGGGGSGGGNTPTPMSSSSLLSGQVVKGLAANSNVTLYKLSDDGTRTRVASTVTNASGSFTLSVMPKLQTGSVYLLEGVGGQFINEFTGQSESLAGPIRAVFVASAEETQFTLSAISELVAIEIERNASTPKWTAAKVSAAMQKIELSLDLASPHGEIYFDLSKLTALQASDLTEEEFQLSFQIGLFAGFYQQYKSAESSVSLATAFSALHELYLGRDQSGQPIKLYLTAGFMQYVDSVPLFSSSKSDIYQAWGLPADATKDDFTGIEFSGAAFESVPNSKLSLYLAYGAPIDTIFNSRGALIGYPSGLGGYAYAVNTGIADVYGNSEIAIGRWNRGYVYQSGASYDRQTGLFKSPNQPATRLAEDYVYAAGVPATNMPQCARKTLRLAAQTKPFLSRDSGMSLSLNSDSRISILSLGSAVYIGYNITLQSTQGITYSFVTSDSVSAPEEGFELNADRTFSASRLPRLTANELLEFRGLLAGEGGRKAVITIYGNQRSTQLAAAFEQEGPEQPCAASLSTGIINPNPISGSYFFNERSVANTLDILNLNFFSNGAPNPNGLRTFGGIVESDALELNGNDLIGMGIYSSPPLSSGLPAYAPTVFTYRKVPAVNAPVLRTGMLNYRLISVTPYLLTDSRQLIAADRRISSAELTIHVSRPPLGDDIPGRGFCRLKVNGGQLLDGGYTQDTGGCLIGDIPNKATYGGGISTGDRKFAVILATEDYGYSFSSQIKGQYAMLFELVP